MQFSSFAHYLDQLEQLNSRLEMTSLLAELFKKLETEETPQACYLMLGGLVPSYQSLEFGMSEKLTMRALAKLLNCLNQDEPLSSPGLFNESDDSLYLKKIQQKNKELGDLGLVIEELVKDLNLNPEQLTILEVHQALSRIAQEEGEGSQDRKIVQTQQLLQKLDLTSIKFVTRIIIGKLRLGFSTMTMIDALSWARLNSKADSNKIEATYQKKADIGQLAQGYLQTQTDQEVQQFFNNYQVQLGIPVLPALCQRLNTAQEIIEKMGRVMMEPKYDGLRTQIHVDKNNQKNPYQVFTRNLDNVTHMFPEIEKSLLQIKANNCILDAEAIAYDPKTKELLPFQETITRKRKYGISRQSKKVPIKFFVFDILFLDGKSLINEKLAKRKQVLAQTVRSNDVIELTEFKITTDPAEVQSYHARQLQLGLEGALIKKVDSVYRSGRKGWRWVKIKEAEGTRGKLNDTLDCVVMGYYRGKGKRTQFGIGAFLVGVLNKEKKVKTIAKIGTGLTDKEFKHIKQLADDNFVKVMPQQYDVPKELKPDVWVAPAIVVEIAADELTASPLHTAGKALRFPRLVKFRQDKDWEQATGLDELAGIAEAK